MEHGRIKRVLIVDDLPDHVEVLKALLEQHGFIVSAAHCGRAALELAASENPDVVLLDLGLPDLSGFDVCRHMRAEIWGASARIIVVSGWTRESDQRRAREAGCDDYVLKPAPVDDLLRLLGDPVH